MASNENRRRKKIEAHRAKRKEKQLTTCSGRIIWKDGSDVESAVMAPARSLDQ